MPKNDGDYTLIVANKKFEVHVLDPKKVARDNVRLTLHADDGERRPSSLSRLRGDEADRGAEPGARVRAADPEVTAARTYGQTSAVTDSESK